MASRILVPTKGAESWRPLLGDPSRHWRDDYLAKATAYAWEDARGLPGDIAAALGDGTELLLAIPEHKVEMPGRGADSQCDVFALCRRDDTLIAAAIEAKVNESFGPTLGEWLAEGGENRQARIDRIAFDLGGSELAPGLRYQLFHRTAAAVYEARRFGAGEAAMIVQSFSPERRWKEDFDAFAQWIGTSGDATSTTAVLPGSLTLRLAWVSSPMPDTRGRP